MVLSFRIQFSEFLQALVVLDQCVFFWIDAWKGKYSHANKKLGDNRVLVA
jgi:hypothetical protein